MKIGGVHYRTIWRDEGGTSVCIIDQTRLPHEFETVWLETLDDAAQAITTMQVRGAPLIGITAAYGLCFALGQDASDAALEQACETLAATRPTAVNLRWALGADEAGAEAGSACGARRGGLREGRAARGRGRGDLPADRPSRPEGHRGNRRAQSRPA